MPSDISKSRLSRLPVKNMFLNGQMCFTSLRPLTSSEPLIVTIPGGPGLDSEYLEPFLVKLAEATSLNVGIMDLPNHGNSRIGKTGFNYPDTLEYLNATVGEIEGKCDGLILFGQSLGARLAFDLRSRSGYKISATILTGFPYEFRISSALGRKLNELPLEKFTGGGSDEQIFARNWRKILPHYSRNPLPSGIFKQLASRTRWVGNENMLNAVPPLKDTASSLRKDATTILVIEGEEDVVVPDDNLSMLKRVLPKARFEKIPDAGHFVMIEQPEATLALMRSFIAQVTGKHD